MEDWKIIEQLASANNDDVIAAILDLAASGETPTSAVAVAVAECLTSGDAEVRGRAAEILGRVADGWVEPLIVKALEAETDWLALISIIETLEELGEDRLYPEMIPHASHECSLVRAYVYRALGVIGGKEAAEKALYEALGREEEDRVVVDILCALANRGDTKAIGRLVEVLLKASHYHVRCAALHSLEELADVMTDTDKENVCRATEVTLRVDTSEAVKGIGLKLLDMLGCGNGSN